MSRGVARRGAARRGAARKLIVLYWLEIYKKIYFCFKIEYQTLKMSYYMTKNLNWKYFIILVEKQVWFFFHRIFCFTLFLLFWTILTLGRNPYNWSFRKLISVSSCICNILSWNFPCFIMVRWQRFNKSIKKKNSKKVSVLKTTLHLHFSFQIHSYM